MGLSLTPTLAPKRLREFKYRSFEMLSGSDVRPDRSVALYVAAESLQVWASEMDGSQWHKHRGKAGITSPSPFVEGHVQDCDHAPLDDIDHGIMQADGVVLDDQQAEPVESHRGKDATWARSSGIEYIKCN